MMNLVKWNPCREMNTLQHRLNHLFADSLFQSGRSEDELSLGTWQPLVDMYDEDDRIIIKAELPGMERKNISVDVKDQVLTTAANGPTENSSAPSDCRRMSIRTILKPTLKTAC